MILDEESPSYTSTTWLKENYKKNKIHHNISHFFLYSLLPNFSMFSKSILNHAPPIFLNKSFPERSLSISRIHP